MKLNDWKREAEEYREVDQAVLAKIEALDAFEYFKARKRWPEGLSTLAWSYLKEHESELSRELPARNELERESGRREF